MTKEVPKGWQTLPLGKIGRFINGRAFKPSEWSTTGFPIIRIQNLTETSKIFNYYNDEVSEKHLVKRGDLLISWSASLGIFQWKGPDAVLNQHIFKVIPDNEIINDKYFYYCMKTKIDQMGKDTHGSTMKHIVKGDFNRTLIPVPPLETQQKIVAILDKAEEIKRLRAEANAQTQKLIQSVFLDMFGDPLLNTKRLPVKKLGEVAHIIMGQSPPGESYNVSGIGIPFLQGKAEFGLNNPLNIKYTTKPCKIAKQGSILISVRAPVGDINLAQKHYCIGRGLASIYSETIDMLYLYHYIKMIKKYIESLGTGSTFKAISSKNLFSMPILVPTNDRQASFHKIIFQNKKNIDNELSITNEINSLIINIQSKAFSGELVV